MLSAHLSALETKHADLDRQRRRGLALLLLGEVVPRGPCGLLERVPPLAADGLVAGEHREGGGRRERQRIEREPRRDRQRRTRRGGSRCDLPGRNAEILRALATGSSNKELANQLFISEATVKTHLIHIYQKLGVDTRTAAVTVARERKLI